MEYIPFAVAFVFGSMLGSFLNVCIHRLPRNESIVSPGSRCYACGTKVQWYDNLPLVSWLVLRGRCRWCGSPFSIRYWLLELLAAALTAAVCWWAFRGSYQLVPGWMWVAAEGGGPVAPLWSRLLAGTALLVFAYAGLVATVIDINWMIIPDEVSKPLLLAAPFLALVVGLRDHLPWTPADWFVTRTLSGLTWNCGGAVGTLLLFILPAIVLLPASLLVARRVYGRLAAVGQDWKEEDFRGLKVGAWFFAIELAVLTAISVGLILAAGPVVALRGPTFSLVHALLGGAAAWWLLWGIGLVGTVAFGRNAMGYGDVKFFAAYGFFLGPVGVAVAFVAAAVCACCVSLPLKLLTADRELPFGPYLVVGAAVSAVWGVDLCRLVLRFLAP